MCTSVIVILFKTECSPYGSAYLSPPPDSNWRRLVNLMCSLLVCYINL